MMGLPRMTLLPSRSSRDQSSPDTLGDKPAKPAIAATAAMGKVERKHAGLFWEIVACGARPGGPGGLLSGWWLWERIARRLWPTFVAPGSPCGVFRIRVNRYRGKPINLPDSTHIDRGAMICEVHCDNEALLSLSRQNSDIYVAGRRDLAAIANWVTHSGISIEAIYGVTLLGAAAARIGFHRRAMPSRRRARADRLFMNGLLAIYSRDGVARLKRGGTLKALPQEIWMSRAELLRRYGPQTTIRSIKTSRPDITSRSLRSSPDAKTRGS